MPNPDQIPYVRTLKGLADTDAISDIPVVGDLYGAANAIVDYWESECHPDWWVYVETLFPAAGDVVLNLLSFGLDDVLRGYFRPEGGRGFGGLGRASRRNRRVTRAQRARGLLRGGIPEIGEMLGRNLPGAQSVRARNVGNAQRFLWRVDGLAQRGLWYWQVADLIEDFTVSWTSGLMRSQDCIGVEVGGVERYSATGAMAGFQSFNPIPLNDVVEEWGNIAHSPISAVIPGGFHGNVTFHASLEHWQPPFGELQLKVAVGSGLDVIKSSGPPVLNEATGRYDTTVNVNVEGGKTYYWGFSNTGGAAIAHDLTAVAIVQGGPA